MLWLYAVLAATVIGGFGKVLHRKITKDEDVQSYSFLFTLVAGLSFVPLLFMEEMALPVGWGWATFFAAALLWFLINVTGFNATKRTEVSLHAPLNKTSVIFLLILATLFLHETLTVQKTIGTLVVFAGAMLLTWEKGSFRKLKERGVQLILLTALLTAGVTLLDKYNMLLGISKSFYGIAMYLIPCFFHGLRVMGRKTHMKRIIRNQGKAILATGIMYGALYYYVLLYAYSFPEAEISVIYPITQLSIIIAVLLGHSWLGEKGELMKRVTASALIIAGAVLVTI